MLSLDQYLLAFKAYDIRGIYDQEIDVVLAYCLGRCVGKYFVRTYGKSGTFLVGSDTRYQNNMLIAYLLHGMHEVGVENLHCALFEPSKKNPAAKINAWGVCSSSMMYGLVYKTFSMGVTCTASHNPKEDVGFKFFDSDAVFLPTDVLRELFLEEWKELQAAKFSFPAEPIPYALDYPALYDRRESLFTFLATEWEVLPKSYNFAVDFCHGAGVSCEKDFLMQYASKRHTIGYLHDYPDGTFPVHGSETQDKANYKRLADDVVAHTRDFGVMFDGDVDRIGFVTNTGRVIPGDIITAIVAKTLLSASESPAAEKVIFDVMSSQVIIDTANSFGATALVNKMGRFFVNQRLKSEHAIFAGECSGHYFFRDIGGYEFPLLVISYVCQQAANYKDFDAMFDAFNMYHKTPVIDVKVVNKDATLASVEKHFAAHKPLDIDGVDVFADDFRVVLRKSNTSDKVRYCVEAKDAKIFERLVQEMKEIVK